MSYKKPKKIKGNVTMFYPNSITMEDGVKISTGPYKKELCGDTYEGVNSYLDHLRFRYNQVKSSKEKLEQTV